MTDNQLRAIGKKIRAHVLKMTLDSKSSHIGSALSIVEILVTLYFKILNTDPANIDDPDRDKFILSKAHGSASLYAILAEKKFFSLDILKKYFVNGGILPGHLDKLPVPGIEFSIGSLGHGLGVGIGMAIAN